MVPLKRRKVGLASRIPAGLASGGPAGVTGTDGTKFPQVVVFLLERKMGSSRRVFLSGLARSKGFKVADDFSGSVTHVVCENNSGDEARTWLGSRVKGRGPAPIHLLDISWFTESMGAGRPVEILQRHRLQERRTAEAETASTFQLPGYACQRRTTLNSHNADLADALSLLAENAELNEEEGRSLAFRRAAAVLKALPAPVTDAARLRRLPGLGEHSLRVVKEILEDGASAEVEAIRRSQHFKALKILTGIFGVGAKTAGRWFRDGIQTLQQLRESGRSLNREQQAGLDHYDDLNRPVTRAEADAIAKTVEAAVVALSPGAQLTLAGGFRRGKTTGHDVDLIITHPEEGREEGLVVELVSRLEEQGLLLYQKTTRNSYLESADGPGRPASTMDRFDRCFAIFKLLRRPEGLHSGGESAAGPVAWRAVRVDLVVSPIGQFAFALLGWTGSKLFERELRRWAGQEKSMSLSSHALYDTKQGRYLRATTEEEIFTHLGLEFIPPLERNA